MCNYLRKMLTLWEKPEGSFFSQPTLFKYFCFLKATLKYTYASQFIKREDFYVSNSFTVAEFCTLYAESPSRPWTGTWGGHGVAVSPTASQQGRAHTRTATATNCGRSAAETRCERSNRSCTKSILTIKTICSTSKFYFPRFWSLGRCRSVLSFLHVRLNC